MNGSFGCVLVIALLTQGLTACSGDEPVAESVVASTVEAPAMTSPRMPDACDLVSSEQAQVVLAQAAGLMSDDPENCMWASMESPGRITMLMLQVSETGNEAQAQILFDAMVGMAGAAAPGAPDSTGNGQLLEGLGDAAWISAMQIDLIGARQLHVRKGSRLLSLNVTGMTSGDSSAQTALATRLQALAQSAVAKL